ncbi:hypothetical protein LOZ80_04750 [Paenibacillus sp. HWE-109]|uniref:hypothetical protein n=1 Tax=Paenibacillus sp. HWE-109 TaxID=1306526 RepID=UPI001EDCC2C0|nr:hypothetical protein [Paenibacillus sp. HWE-109]UKS28249.1 hypothetical protein LOZ80_04750 [Paenibacillus sp. HWE-109]
MFAKIVFISLLFTPMLIYDLPKWKRGFHRDRLVYGAFILPILYLSIIYVADAPWPNLDELIRIFFSNPAKHIVELVELPS